VLICCIWLCLVDVQTVSSSISATVPTCDACHGLQAGRIHYMGARSKCCACVVQFRHVGVALFVETACWLGLLVRVCLCSSLRVSLAKPVDPNLLLMKCSVHTPYGGNIRAGPGAGHLLG
jgi:hypothetical protein